MKYYRHFFLVFNLLLASCCALLPLAALAQFAPPPLVLPFDYKGYIVLKAKINGKHTANLLLDTGADELLLDAQYFNSTGITIERSQQALLPGAGTEPQRITVVLDPMTAQLDTITYRPRYVPLLDLRSIVGEKADGIIGPAFLRPYLTEIDFEKQQLTLHTDPLAITGFDSVRLEVQRNRYYLPISIEATEGLIVKGMLQFDIGNSGHIILTSPTALDYGLATKISKKTKFFNDNGGVGGRIEGYQFRAKSLKIGQTRIHEPCIEWSTDTSGALANSAHAGLLGNEMLERFWVIVDFKNALLYLKPKPAHTQPFFSNISGMTTINKRNTLGALVVTGLFEGGNAEKAGLKAGDRIIVIGGKKVAEMSDEALELVFKKPDSPVEITFTRDKTEQTVWLERVERL